MRIAQFLATALITAMCSASATEAAAQQGSLPPVEGNDNRRPVGVVGPGVVTVSLFAARGAWRPERGDGPALEVAAFAEEGGSLLTPGPLVRVAEGTELTVRVRNTLADSLYVHGFVTRPATEDVALNVPAGETREVRFAAGAPGTYAYWASTTRSTLTGRREVDSQLGGAFIIDPRGEPAGDRVFVLTNWDETPAAIPDSIITPDTRRVFAINGFSWPHTERLDERVGHEARWRFVNLTPAGHPMHLHGFYFRVQAAGTALTTAAYSPDEYRQVVTQFLPGGGTMQIAWTPERDGNWLLHCHMVSHVTPALRYWLSPQAAGNDQAGHSSHDPATAMAGLVLGIRVAASDRAIAKTPAGLVAPTRQMTLTMRKQQGHWKPEDAYGFSLASSNEAADRDEVTVPGPLLVLQRGEPVEILLKNELPEATAIHWHGIELESHFDGVPGWSGSASSRSTTPAIEAGGSFRVRFTPPRVGTFMYHTHSHDLRQLASGLYGAIVVLEPGETFDPLRDHLVILAMEGTKNTLKYDRFPVVVNGTRSESMTFKGGVPNRLRVINITTSFDLLNVSLTDRTQPMTWRLIAKDGAELPPNQRITRPAWRHHVTVGEIYDFLVEAPATGQAWIEVRRASGEWIQQVPVRIVP